jgi:hypothetical protein
MTSDDFTLIDFPPAQPQREGVIYVFFWVDEGVLTPFYVGETDRFIGRMDDYEGASFKATADFKVGEAIKYLKNAKNYRVVVGHRQSANRRDEEKRMISKYRADVPLLNDLPGYDYRTANMEDERLRVQRFCDELIEKWSILRRGSLK